MDLLETPPLKLSQADKVLLAAGCWSATRSIPAGLRIDQQAITKSGVAEAVIEQSVYARMLPMVLDLSEQLGWSWPAEIMAFNEFFRIKNETLFSSLDRISREISKEKIPFLLLKGTDLMLSVYPKDLPRQVADLDFLVSEEDAPRVVEVLNDYGYRPGTVLLEQRNIKPLTKAQEREMVDRYELPAMMRFNTIDLGRLSASPPMTFFDTTFYGIQGEEFIFVENFDVHTNISYDIDPEDIWHEPRLVSPEHSYRGQSPSALLWFLASRFYHEIMLSSRPKLRHFVDVLAVVNTLGSEVNWESLLQAAEKYKLQPGLFYMLWHVDAMLPKSKIPAEALRQLHPLTTPECRTHDWGDFMPKMFDQVAGTPVLESDRGRTGS